MADCGDDVAAELREEINEERKWLERHRDKCSAQITWTFHDCNADGEYVYLGIAWGNNEVAMAAWKRWMETFPNCTLSSKPTSDKLHIQHLQHYYKTREKIDALEAKLASLLKDDEK